MRLGRAALKSDFDEVIEEAWKWLWEFLTRSMTAVTRGPPLAPPQFTRLEIRSATIGQGSIKAPRIGPKEAIYRASQPVTRAAFLFAPRA